MKRLIETEEGGLPAMLGENVCLFCGVYIYAGKLSGVNDTHVELTEAKLVYETGHLVEGGWKDAQKLPGTWRVMVAAIESWGGSKCE